MPFLNKRDKSGGACGGIRKQRIFRSNFLLVSIGIIFILRYLFLEVEYAAKESMLGKTNEEKTPTEFSKHLECPRAGMPATVKTPVFGALSPQMCVHNGDDIISTTIRSTKTWEISICESISESCRNTKEVILKGRKWWFIDVGTNIGFVSLCGFEHMPTLGVEAAPWNFEIVEATRRFWMKHITGRPWTIVNAALVQPGEENKTMSMRASSGNLGGSNIVTIKNHPEHNQGWGSGASHEGEIPTTLLDRVVKENIPDSDCIGVMKIDIEGYEYFALLGAADMFRSRRPCHVYMEFHTVLLKAAASPSKTDPTPGKLLDLMRNYGYAQVGKVIDYPEGREDEIETDIHWVLKDEHHPEGVECKCF